MSYHNGSKLVASRVRVEPVNNRVQHFFDFPSKTDQSFKKDCDINSMIKRFTKSNGWDKSKLNAYLLSISPKFDHNSVIDGSPISYDEHVQNVQQADEMFASLPSAIRAQFKNDPGLLLKAVQDPSQATLLDSMGLLTPEASNRLKEASIAAKTASIEAAKALLASASAGSAISST